MSMSTSIMDRLDLRGLTCEELQVYLNGIECKPYRARQVSEWIYGKKLNSISDMSNLSKTLREELEKKCYISSLVLLDEQVSLDGTVKFIFELEDKERIESVLIPDDKRFTLCISTQVGCKFNCSFCYTGKMGFKRNLSSGEIINQIIFVEQNYKKITNVVFMGMGEPLDNYENMIKAVKIICSPWGLGISARKITLSTCGLVPEMERLKEENLNINLAVSLNASYDNIRSRLMPVNKKYPIKRLLQTCREYPLNPGRRITFEYVLIKEINDSEKDAKRLARLLKGIRCKINLLPFNRKPDEKCLYQPPGKDKVNKFHEYLISQNFSVFTRKQRGIDISASCGQLTAKR